MTEHQAGLTLQMISFYSNRIEKGQHLTEDEAMFYYQMCATLKLYYRVLEVTYTDNIIAYEKEKAKDENNPG